MGRTEEKNSMSGRMRSAEVGQVLTFPIEKYSSVRAAASVMKIQYGKTFTVRYDRDAKIINVTRTE